MRVSISGTSHAQQLGLHDPLATGPLAPPGGIGTPTGFADRTYDNGYVKLDPGTGNPNSLDPNTTWNWGFNNPAQYNAGAQTLSFQKQGAPGYTATQNQAADGSADMTSGGVQIELGRSLVKSGKWSLDVCLRFQGSWSGHEKLNTSTYGEEVRQITVTDTYDVSGIGSANFPAGGFSGTYLGPFDTPPVVPSPVIPNLPGSRSQSTSAALSSSANRIGFDVDQSLYEIAVGPQIGFQATPRLKLHLRPSLSLNVIDVDAKRSEVFVQTPAGGGSVVLNSWADYGSQSDVLLGFGVTGGADLDLGNNFYLGVFGGYDYVADPLKVAVGPNTVKVDPSGWVVGIVIGKIF